MEEYAFLIVALVGGVSGTSMACCALIASLLTGTCVYYKRSEFKSKTTGVTIEMHDDNEYVDGGIRKKTVILKFDKNDTSQIEETIKAVKNGEENKVAEIVAGGGVNIVSGAIGGGGGGITDKIIEEGGGVVREYISSNKECQNSNNPSFFIRVVSRVPWIGSRYKKSNNSDNNDDDDDQQLGSPTDYNDEDIQNYPNLKSNDVHPYQNYPYQNYPNQIKTEDNTYPNPDENKNYYPPASYCYKNGTLPELNEIDPINIIFEKPNADSNINNSDDLELSTKRTNESEEKKEESQEQLEEEIKEDENQADLEKENIGDSLVNRDAKPIKHFPISSRESDMRDFENSNFSDEEPEREENSDSNETDLTGNSND